MTFDEIDVQRVSGRLSRFVAIGALALALYGCNGNGGKTDVLYDMGEWRDLLKGNGNWHVIRIPDSKVAPGSIVKITEADGLSWIDSLQSCGIPRGLLVARTSDAQEESLVLLGASPSIKFTKKVEFGAGVLLNISGIKAGPEFSKVRKTVLTIGANGGDALRLIALQTWIQKNPSSYNKACSDRLAQPDHYLISESFRFSSATFSLLDESGTKVAVTLPQYGKLLQFEPSVKYSVTSDGDLRIEQPMYVAVRRAIAASDGFGTLRRPGEKSGDAALEKHNRSLK
jgi:hypothetical protein